MKRLVQSRCRRFFPTQSCVFQPTPVHKRAVTLEIDSKGQRRHGLHSVAKSLLLLLQLTNTHLIHAPEQREESEHVKSSEPDRLVPGRRDVEIQTRSLFIPHSVAIASYDSEMVFAGTKPGVKSFATVARVLPVLIHSFQPVTKTHLLWHSHAQCCVDNLQIGCSRG